MIRHVIERDPLEQVVCELAGKEEERARVLGVAGCRPDDGASFVTHALARSIATRVDQEVLEAALPDLLGCLSAAPADLFGACHRSSARLWRFSPKRDISVTQQASLSRLKQVLHVLGSRFRFVVVDCGAVSVSGALWPVSQTIDQLLLVVAAGETKKAQIAYALRLIERSGTPFAGCVLNKRTYPLPRRLYRLFA